MQSIIKDRERREIEKVRFHTIQSFQNKIFKQLNSILRYTPSKNNKKI